MWPSTTHRPIHLVQPPSVAISRNQSQSVTINAPAHPSRPTAISRNQSQSVAISRNQRTGPSISSDHSFAGRLAQPCTPSLVISRPSASTLRAAPRPTCGEGWGGRRAEHLHAASTVRAAPRPTSHVAFGGNQSQSAVISRHQSTHLPRGIRWQAEALSGVGRSAVHHLCDLCVRSQHIPVGKGGRRGEHTHAIHHLCDLSRSQHIPAKLGTPQ